MKIYGSYDLNLIRAINTIETPTQLFSYCHPSKYVDIITKLENKSYMTDNPLFVIALIKQGIVFDYVEVATHSKTGKILQIPIELDLLKIKILTNSSFMGELNGNLYSSIVNDFHNKQLTLI